MRFKGHVGFSRRMFFTPFVSVPADFRGGQQRQGHLSLFGNGRAVDPGPVQPHPQSGNLHPGPPPLLSLHHHHHPHQLYPHDYAKLTESRVNRVRILSI